MAEAPISKVLRLTKRTDLAATLRNAENGIEKTVYLPIRPNPTLTAHYDKNVPGGVATDERLGACWALIRSERNKSPQLFGLGELMCMYGLRVSEVLRVKGGDIKPNGLIYIRGLKGSADRVVMPVESRDWWLAQRGMDGCVLEGFDRFWVRRQFMRLGIGEVMKGRKTASVTHLPRHLVAQMLEGDGSEIQDIAKVLGHKSLKSTEWYTSLKVDG